MHFLSDIEAAFSDILESVGKKAASVYDEKGTKSKYLE